MRYLQTGVRVWHAQRRFTQAARRAAVVAGNALEFYDFLVFGFFAIQIGRVFFPAGSETASLLATLAVFRRRLSDPAVGWR